MSLIPVRCFTCGKVVGNRWEAYQAWLAEGLSPSKALSVVGLERYCCRRMLLTHVDTIGKVLAGHARARAPAPAPAPPLYI